MHPPPAMGKPGNQVGREAGPVCTRRPPASAEDLLRPGSARRVLVLGFQVPGVFWESGVRLLTGSFRLLTLGPGVALLSSTRPAFQCPHLSPLLWEALSRCSEFPVSPTPLRVPRVRRALSCSVPDRLSPSWSLDAPLSASSQLGRSLPQGGASPDPSGRDPCPPHQC